MAPFSFLIITAQLDDVLFAKTRRTAVRRSPERKSCTTAPIVAEGPKESGRTNFRRAVEAANRSAGPEVA